LVGRDGDGYSGDLGRQKTDLFLHAGLDHPNQVDPAEEIFRLAQTDFRPRRTFFFRGALETHQATRSTG
jgi:hypothetical protein